MQQLHVYAVDDSADRKHTNHYAWEIGYLVTVQI